MNRQLNCFIARPPDTPLLLAEELVQYGFIHALDSSLIQVTQAMQFIFIQILCLFFRRNDIVSQRQRSRSIYSYFNIKIYFYMPNFASIGRVDLVLQLSLVQQNCSL